MTTIKKINSAFIISIIIFIILFVITFYSNVDLIQGLAKAKNISEMDALNLFVHGNEYYLVFLFSFYALLFSFFSYLMYITLGFLNFLFKK